ncbi:hypothetical protein KIPB_001369, partial [Kipferlia bialata]
LIAEYSRIFEEGLIALLSTRYYKKRVLMNQVYNEYIKDKDHVHMNATKWTSLTGFTHYLSKLGVVQAEFVNDMWWVTYHDNQDVTLQRMERERAANQAESSEAVLRANLRRQIENGKGEAVQISAAALVALSQAPEMKLSVGDTKRKRGGNVFGAEDSDSD